MKRLIVKLKKSFIIPDADYEIFKNVNFYRNDGANLFFDENTNGLYIFDANDRLISLFNFKSFILEKKEHYAIEELKAELEQDVDPVKDFDTASSVVDKVVKEAFQWLEDIIKNDERENGNIVEEPYKYYFYDKDKFMYNQLITLKGRENYVALISQIGYKFGFADE